MSDEIKNRATTPNPWWAGRTRLILAGAALLVIAGLVWVLVGTRAARSTTATTFVAERGTFDVTVVESGIVEAMESQEIQSEIRGRSGAKILYVVEEGYVVTPEDVAEGKVLVELDPTELEDELVNQEIAFQSAEAAYKEQLADHEIQVSQNQSQIAAAELTAKFALMDFQKFLGQQSVDQILDELGIDKETGIFTKGMGAVEVVPAPVDGVSPVLDPGGIEAASPDPERVSDENGSGDDPRPRRGGRRGNRSGTDGESPLGGPRGEWPTGGDGQFRSRGDGPSGGFPGSGGGNGDAAPSGPPVPLTDELIEAIANAMREQGMPVDPERFRQMIPSGAGGEAAMLPPQMIDRMKDMGVDIRALADGLDSSSAEPEVPESTSEPSEILIQADSEYTRARDALDFNRYADIDKLEDGQAKEKLRELQDAVLLADEEFRLAKTRLDGQRRLAEKEFITQNDLDLEKVKVQRADVQLSSAKAELELYIRYDFPQEAEQLLSDYEEALMNLDRTRREAAADLSRELARLKSSERHYNLEKSEFEDVQEQLAKTVIRAERTGLVVYGSTTESNPFRRNNEDPIMEGAIVRERQRIITIPDMTRMSVRVNIQESAVKRVVKGQPATVRLEANKDLQLEGKVARVAVLADSANMFLNPEIKVYPTVVQIDGVHDWLRPGMTAEVEILIERVEDVVYIPIQAVSHESGSRVVYVSTGDGVERRRIETGSFNEEFIEITSGLREGETVRLLKPARSVEPAQSEDEEAAPEMQPPSPELI